MPDYGPNVVVPEPHEADRDEHETQYAAGRCTPADPCGACRRFYESRRR